MHNPPVTVWNLSVIEQSGQSGNGPSEEATDYWEATIQRNFKEFSSTMEQKLDYTMEDAVESDEEAGEFKSAE